MLQMQVVPQALCHIMLGTSPSLPLLPLSLPLGLASPRALPSPSPPILETNVIHHAVLLAPSQRPDGTVSGERHEVWLSTASSSNPGFASDSLRDLGQLSRSLRLVCKIKIRRLPRMSQTQRCTSQIPLQGCITAPVLGCSQQTACHYGLLGIWLQPRSCPLTQVSSLPGQQTSGYTARGRYISLAISMQHWTLWWANLALRPPSPLCCSSASSSAHPTSASPFPGANPCEHLCPKLHLSLHL